MKIFWENFISPDLEFRDYEKIPRNHQKKYDETANLDKSKLLNI